MSVISLAPGLPNSLLLSVDVKTNAYPGTLHINQECNVAFLMLQEAT
jgi:hypothetical protein